MKREHNGLRYSLHQHINGVLSVYLLVAGDRIYLGDVAAVRKKQWEWVQAGEWNPSPDKYPSRHKAVCALIDAHKETQANGTKR